MAKGKAPQRGGIDDNKQATPLYKSGRTNGPVGGPTQPPRVPDPLGYLSDPGMQPPSGNTNDTPTPAHDAPANHHGRTRDGKE